MIRRGVLGVLLCLSLFGCDLRQPASSKAGLPPEVAEAGLASGVAPVGARVGGPVGVLAPPVAAASYGRPVGAGATAGPGAGAAGVAPPGDVSLDFADTDIRTVVAQILGTILQQNYTIDPSVQGTATLRTVQPLSRNALIPTLQTLLAQNNAVLVMNGGLYRVMPADKAPPGIAGSADLGGSAVVTLHYASAADLAAALQPYVSGNGKIVVAPGQNALIVQGDPATRQALLALIASFDVDQLAGQSFELFPVASGDAKSFASAFTAALVKGGGGAGANAAAANAPVTVVPLERMSAVLVIAQNQSLLYDAQRVYAVLNQAQRQTVRSWHAYFVQNGHANDAAYILQEAFTPDNVTAVPTPQATGQVSTALANQSGVGSGSSGTSGSSVGGITGLGGTGGIGGVIGSSVTNAPPASSSTSGGATSGGATSGAAALLGPLSGGAGGTAPADEMRIIPDNDNNSILIYATADENDLVDAMLTKIDVTPVQVRIDATIAEVDLTGQLQYGTQYFFKTGGINSILTTGTTAALDASFPGFVLSGRGSDGAPLAISLLQSVTRVNVLSSPELMVLDGQPASLQVGNLVPYLAQTSQSTLTSDSQVVNSIDYRETGVILQVTPHVGADGLVTLDVSQEVSGVESAQTTTGIDSPTFSERAVTSRVAIQDGQTVGLAGLISDNDSHQNSGIPFLKNIPIIGGLAGSQNNQRTRTELLVLITPHVIRAQGDAQALTQDMQEELPNAAEVPATLQLTPVGGSADPDEAVRNQVPQ